MTGRGAAPISSPPRRTASGATSPPNPSPPQGRGQGEGARSCWRAHAGGSPSPRPSPSVREREVRQGEGASKVLEVPRRWLTLTPALSLSEGEGGSGWRGGLDGAGGSTPA